MSLAVGSQLVHIRFFLYVVVRRGSWHRKGTATVGVRHFADQACGCKICESHKPKLLLPAAAPVPDPAE